MNEKGTIDRLPFDDYDAGHRSSLVFQGACWSTHCSDDVVRNLSTTSDTMEARSEDAVRNTLSARPGACFGSPLACHRRGPGWVCAFLNSAGVHEAKGSTKYCRNNRRMVFLVADFKSYIVSGAKESWISSATSRGIVDHAPGCPQILISRVNSRRGLPASVCSGNVTIANA